MALIRDTGAGLLAPKKGKKDPLEEVLLTPAAAAPKTLSATSAPAPVAPIPGPGTATTAIKPPSTPMATVTATGFDNLVAPSRGNAPQLGKSFTAPASSTAPSLPKPTTTLAPNVTTDAIIMIGETEKALGRQLTPEERQKIIDAEARFAGTGTPILDAPQNQGGKKFVDKGETPPLAASATQPTNNAPVITATGQNQGPITADNLPALPSIPVFTPEPFTPNPAFTELLTPLSPEEQLQRAQLLANLQIDPLVAELQRQLETGFLGVQQDVESLFGASYQRALRQLQDQMQQARERQVGVTNAQGKLFSPLGRGEIARAEQPYAQAIGDVTLQNLMAAQQVAQRYELLGRQIQAEMAELASRRGQLTAAEAGRLQQLERDFASLQQERDRQMHLAEQGLLQSAAEFNRGSQFGLFDRGMNLAEFDLQRELGRGDLALRNVLGLGGLALDQARFGLDQQRQNTLLPFERDLAQQRVDAGAIENQLAQLELEYQRETNPLRKEMLRAQISATLAQAANAGRGDPLAEREFNQRQREFEAEQDLIQRETAADILQQFQAAFGGARGREDALNVVRRFDALASMTLGEPYLSNLRAFMQQWLSRAYPEQRPNEGRDIPDTPDRPPPPGVDAIWLPDFGWVPNLPITGAP